MEFKNFATRLGWDAEKKTIDCPKEWWDEHLAISTVLPNIFLSIICFAKPC
jgi:hypothetical protein